MSQQDIEVLTTIMSIPSPDIRGHAQPVDSLHILNCFYCGNKRHNSKSYPKKIVISSAMSSDVIAHVI